MWRRILDALRSAINSRHFRSFSDAAASAADVTSPHLGLLSVTVLLLHVQDEERF